MPRFGGNPLSHGPNVNTPLMPHQMHKKEAEWGVVNLGQTRQPGDDSDSSLRLIHKSQTPADSILCEKNENRFARLEPGL
jgi:hypothetical protein